MTRRVPDGDPIGSVQVAEFVEANLPALFHGCAVHMMTPLHHNVGIVDPDTSKFTWET